MEKGRGKRDEKGEDTPAFKGIHELAGHVEALAHQASLMADGLEGIAQQTDLVLWRGGGSHAVGRDV